MVVYRWWVMYRKKDSAWFIDPEGFDGGWRFKDSYMTRKMARGQKIDFESLYPGFEFRVYDSWWDTVSP